MFEDLGLKYVGPVDGHDVGAIESALRKAKGFGAPGHRALRHDQGLRVRPAEDARHRPHAQRRHHRSAYRPAGVDRRRPHLDLGVLRADARSSVRRAQTSSPSPRRCSIRWGSPPSPQRWPDRVFDVGIAEQHAVTSAAGLAMGGMRPIVAVYATFMNRAFDQVLMDVAMHKLPVVFVMDRAGRHRRGRRLAQRHVGHVLAADRARARSRGPARRGAPGGRAGAGAGTHRRPERHPLPEGHAAESAARGPPGGQRRRHARAGR